MKRTMIKTIPLWAVGALSIAFSGCFSDDSAKPGHTQEASGSPAWTVQLKSACDQIDAQDCVAAYGFTVSADGRYLLGPGPEGQVQRGTVHEEELAALLAQVNSVAGGDALTSDIAETCQDAVNQEAATVDSVDLIYLGKQKQVYSTKGHQACFQTANIDSARALHDTIRSLAKKYYSLPFPDHCTDAVTDLQNLYPGIQHCAVDSDCSYVSLDYASIPPQTPEFVVTDSCSLAKPLVVANTTALAEAAASLQAALDRAQAACGQRIVTPGCVSVKGFSADVGNPVCQQGTCQLPAAAAGH